MCHISLYRLPAAATQCLHYCIYHGNLERCEFQHQPSICHCSCYKVSDASDGHGGWYMCTDSQ